MNVSFDELKKTEDFRYELTTPLEIKEAEVLPDSACYKTPAPKDEFETPTPNSWSCTKRYDPYCAAATCPRKTWSRSCSSVTSSEVSDPDWSLSWYNLDGKKPTYDLAGHGSGKCQCYCDNVEYGLNQLKTKYTPEHLREISAKCISDDSIQKLCNEHNKGVKLLGRLDLFKEVLSVMDECEKTT